MTRRMKAVVMKKADGTALRRNELTDEQAKEIGDVVADRMHTFTVEELRDLFPDGTPDWTTFKASRDEMIGRITNKMLADPELEIHFIQRRAVTTMLDGTFNDFARWSTDWDHDAALTERRFELLNEMIDPYTEIAIHRQISVEDAMKLRRLLIEWDASAAKYRVMTPWIPGQPREDIEENGEDDDRLSAEAVRDMIERLREVVRVGMPEVQRAEEEERQEERAARIAAKREAHQEAQPMGRKCSSCHKRDAKFDDLCGRCADEAGVRPHGKIA